VAGAKAAGRVLMFCLGPVSPISLIDPVFLQIPQPATFRTLA